MSRRISSVDVVGHAHRTGRASAGGHRVGCAIGRAGGHACPDADVQLHRRPAVVDRTCGRPSGDVRRLRIPGRQERPALPGRAGRTRHRHHPGDARRGPGDHGRRPRPRDHPAHRGVCPGPGRRRVQRRRQRWQPRQRVRGRRRRGRLRCAARGIGAGRSHPHRRGRRRGCRQPRLHPGRRGRRPRREDRRRRTFSAPVAELAATRTARPAAASSDREARGPTDDGFSGPGGGGGGGYYGGSGGNAGLGGGGGSGFGPAGTVFQTGVRSGAGRHHDRLRCRTRR